MSLGMLFWVLYVVWFIFGGWVGLNLPAGPERPRYWGTSLFLLVLIFLLGWKVFGFVVKD